MSSIIKKKSFEIPRQLTFVKEERIDSIDWSPNGDKLAIAGDRYIIIYDYLKKEIKKIDAKNEEQIISFGVWSTDSNKFTVSVKDNAYAPGELWIKTLANGRFERILKSKKPESSYKAMAWSPDGNWLLIKRRILPKTKENIIYNINKKKGYKVELPVNLRRGKIIGWNQKDKNTLYLVTKKGLWLLDFDRLTKKQINQKMIEKMEPFR